MPKEERHKLLSEAGVGVEMNASQTVDIKADLGTAYECFEGVLVL